MRTIEREIVSALIFSKDGKIFQGFRDPSGGGVYPDCWHLPGGGVESGEDLAEGAKREALEEMGIDLSDFPAELIDDVGRGEGEKTLPSGERVLTKMKFNVFKIQLNTNAADVPVNLSDEFIVYRWVAPEELKNVQLTPPSIELFQRLGYL